MRWIGITGPMGSGKDHLYKEIESRMPNDVVRVSFADQVRAEIELVLRPQDPATLWQKPYKYEIRRLLQWWGTELRRADDPDYWVKRAEAVAEDYDYRGLTPIFTDVRFPNESDMIRRNGGLIVQVWASLEHRQERLGGVLPSDHASETELEKIVPELTLYSGPEFPDLYEEDVSYILKAARQ